MEGRGQGWWPEDEEGGGREPNPGEERKESGGGPPEPPPRPPRGLASRDRPRVASRYSMFVGAAFAIIVILAVANAINTDEGGIAGSTPEADRGVPVVEFAVPDVRGDVPGDANLDQDDCQSGRNPCPEDEIRTPACEIEPEGAIRVCDLFGEPLAMSFWFTRGGDCLASQDAFDAVARERSDEVNFLSLNVLDDREEVAEIVTERGWEVPVGHDADGAVSNVFGVGVCPTIILAYPGGIIHRVEIKPGNFEPAEIDAMIDELVQASERREPAA